MKKLFLAILILVTIALRFSTQGLAESKSDLRAIDSNGDGVWDDIEAAIKNKFGTSPLANAQKQLAKAMQKALLEPDKAIQLEDEMESADACLAAHNPSLNDEISSFVEDTLINSATRSRLYLAYNKHLSGHMLIGKPTNKSFCK